MELMTALRALASQHYSMTLTAFPPHRYSQFEYHLFSAIPQDGSTTGNRELAAARAVMGDWDAANQVNTIAVTMARLMKKIEANNEPFRLRKTERQPGQNKVEYWLERVLP